ncbi:MAG TPA: hypothetical protein IAC50_07785 [Candidatus Copromorpha excrementigallinarum]|uniref:DAGKc domain-containing protein n=1 Tax=Candidatus Allocopromorpha excrementigallinarum TaxID=2840742 RepID=A0A9D1I1D0_9FIRM|nr:hypothetical protein [Candidatus Copromorpha excrementigallinarum]
MKHIFIVNPASCKRKKEEKMEREIKAAAAELGEEYEIYRTKAPKDGENYVRRLCEGLASRGEAVRIYACGGDGTINEVVNGAFGYENAEIGAVPLGTGNDYIRNYGMVSDFLNIKRQMKGKSRYSDLIEYRAVCDGRETKGLCANMFNIGFDCNVVDLTARIKKLPFLRGSLAYLVSVFIILVEKRGANLRIEYASGPPVDGRILLVAVANGCYCGGGVKGVPYCRLDDGLMDVSVVKNVTRRFFIRLFPSYSKGTHLENREMREKKVIRYSREKTLTIRAKDRYMRLCTDGEITSQESVEFSVIKDAFRFIVPEGPA